jgi:hypothetical protein
MGSQGKKKERQYKSSGQGGRGIPTLAWLISLEDVSGKSTLSTHLFYLLKIGFVH